MLARLRGLRQREPSPAMRASYQAAIDRLDALAYRLTEAAAARPARPPAPLPRPRRSPGPRR